MFVTCSQCFWGRFLISIILSYSVQMVASTTTQIPVLLTGWERLIYNIKKCRHWQKMCRCLQGATQWWWWCVKIWASCNSLAMLLNICWTTYPTASIYDVFTYIYHKHHPIHVGKYTIHGWYGYEKMWINECLFPLKKVVITWPRWEFLEKSWKNMTKATQV